MLTQSELADALLESASLRTFAAAALLAPNTQARDSVDLYEMVNAVISGHAGNKIAAIKAFRTFAAATPTLAGRIAAMLPSLNAAPVILPGYQNPSFALADSKHIVEHFGM